jgi:4-amino-4-deoxy-L-arabinose transferase-like glycosyltransferase
MFSVPKKTLSHIGLLFTLVIAAYVRLLNLAQNPGWYTDEATHLLIAQQLTHGRFQYLAINQSTLLFARLPLFEGLLAGAGSLFGLNMLTLRVLTAVLTLLTTLLIYALCRQISHDDWLPLLAALMYAIYPQAVVYGRFGFSYHLLTPFLLLAIGGLWDYWQTGKRHGLIVAALTIGLGTISDLWMLSLLPVLCLIVLHKRWRDLWWAVSLALLLFGVYTAVSLLTHPAAFLFDLQYSLFRANALPLADQLQTVTQNYTILLTQDVWLALGLLGLFLLHPLPLRRLLLLFWLLPLLIIGRTIALHDLSAYYLIPLQPLVALGLANLLRVGWPVVQQTVRITAVALFLIAIPFLITWQHTWQQVGTQFNLSIDPFLTNAADAQKTAAFLIPRLSPDDTVIAAPTISWLLPAQTADFQLMVAATGQATPHLPADIPADRYVFDPRYSHARYAIIDNLWRNWGVPNIPTLDGITADIETWPLVFQTGSIAVYANPNLPDS